MAWLAMGLIVSTGVLTAMVIVLADHVMTLSRLVHVLSERVDQLASDGDDEPRETKPAHLRLVQ
jgi:hypothetical protein